ncbi:MAG: sugar porter family MFS transporter [Phycisphaerales bacterium]|nr:sugar porter family MFS transporter [Phycisphaerales bacterium]
MKARLISTCITAALGGLLFGFDTAVISGTTEALQSVFSLSDGRLGFAVSSALIGTIFGAAFAGFAADGLGRRNSLLLIGLLYAVSATGSALAWSEVSFVLFRWIGGVGVGGASVISAMYIAEISPARYRGLLVGAFQLNIVIGILVAYLSNYVISQFGQWHVETDVGTGLAASLQEAHLRWTHEVEWRLMFGAEVFPAVVFLMLLSFSPRSPRWLVAKGLESEARQVLRLVGTDGGDIDAEIEAIRDSLRAAADQRYQPLFCGRYRKPILLALALATFNQLSGINAVLYYAPTIFRNAGASEDAALLFPVWLGVANLVFTIVGLAMIDKFGRRYLLLIGSVGYIASLGTAAAAFFRYGPDFGPTSNIIVLAALALFIASHAVGQGAVIWVYIGEIFPNAVRARGQALGGLTHWAWAAALSFAFPSLLSGLGGAWVFTMFTGFMVLQLFWVIISMRETKGVPLEEIEQALGTREAGVR